MHVVKQTNGNHFVTSTAQRVNGPIINKDYYVYITQTIYTSTLFTWYVYYETGFSDST